MKKLLALALMGTFTLTVFGQGQVQFNNRVTAAGVDAPIMYNGVKADGTDPLIRAALLGGMPSATAATTANAGTLSMLANPDNAGLTWVGFRTGAAAGYLNVGSAAARLIPDVNWGGSAQVQVVGWYGNYTSYAEAIAANAPVGVSPAFTLTLPSGPTDPNVANLVGLQSFTIGGVPEPSTFALAGLGAAALVIFRRRK